MQLIKSALQATEYKLHLNDFETAFVIEDEVEIFSIPLSMTVDTIVKQ